MFSSPIFSTFSSSYYQFLEHEPARLGHVQKFIRIVCLNESPVERKSLKQKIYKKRIQIHFKGEKITFIRGAGAYLNIVWTNQVVINLVWTNFKDTKFSWLYIWKYDIFKALSQNIVWTSPHVHICSGAPVHSHAAATAVLGKQIQAM